MSERQKKLPIAISDAVGLQRKPCPFCLQSVDWYKQGERLTPQKHFVLLETGEILECPQKHEKS